MLILILVLLSDNATNQILLNLLVTQFAIITKFMSDPYRWKESKRLDLFNESMVMIFAYHLLIYTDFVPDPVIREQLGESQIVISGILIQVNVLLISIGFIRNALRSYRKWRYEKRKPFFPENIRKAQRKRVEALQKDFELKIPKDKNPWTELEYMENNKSEVPDIQIFKSLQTTE